MADRKRPPNSGPQKSGECWHLGLWSGPGSVAPPGRFTPRGFGRIVPTGFDFSAVRPHGQNHEDPGLQLCTSIKLRWIMHAAGEVLLTNLFLFSSRKALPDPCLAIEDHADVHIGGEYKVHPGASSTHHDRNTVVNIMRVVALPTPGTFMT
ncbi:hypothetical protein ZHAS_00003463 [Anopheles sinensis]|uniref:Uncharacterized protein n=1 Tax=Anopheles sinensis TaxID=74873 RepID=A0A084VEE4_ANOSI|nr:hypothetical protein ZHAS_00003463 [Anopheles sinensis]